MSSRQSKMQVYGVEGYLPTIGIECHVQLKTDTKLFAPVAVGNFRADAANQHLTPLCLGLPGALPVINRKAVDLAICAGLALDCGIASVTSFDRKHYFYPDLPLGYQISQHYQPLVLAGEIIIPLPDGGQKAVGIHHAHLEADAGKLTHPKGRDYSLLDLNRVGVPLLEIVSQPDMHSPTEAQLYAKEIYLRMIYAGVCEGDLSAGHLRFDVNVSVSDREDVLGTRTEIKNLNSFRFIHQAVTYEIDRQIKLHRGGESVVQETRGWDEQGKSTFAQRSKEDAQDYRYMPDPDLPPLQITEAHVDSLKKSLNVSPPAVRDLLKGWRITASSIEIMLEEWSVLVPVIYENRQTLDGPRAVVLVNWLLGDLLAALKQSRLTQKDIVATWSELLVLAQAVLDDKVSATGGKKWLMEIVQDKKTVARLLQAAGGGQISDVATLQPLVDRVFDQHPGAVEDARVDSKAIGFLVGKVMQDSRGRANPSLVNDLIKRKLAGS